MTRRLESELPTYRIHFTYVERRRLRTKWKEVTAKTVNMAVEKLKREFGWVKVWKTE